MAITSYFEGGTGEGSEYDRKMNFVIDSAADVANLPTSSNAAIPGSIAYTADFSLIYCLNNSFEWVEVS